jgi:hypothetical protein
MVQRDLGQRREASIRAASTRPEIQNVILPNKSLQRYCQINLLDHRIKNYSTKEKKDGRFYGTEKRKTTRNKAEQLLRISERSVSAFLSTNSSNIWYIASWILKAKQCSCTVPYGKAKQYRYTPWRRLGGEEV